MEFMGFVGFAGFVEFVELTKQGARNIKQSSLPDRGRELKRGGEKIVRSRQSGVEKQSMVKERDSNYRTKLCSYGVLLV